MNVSKETVVVALVVLATALFSTPIFAETTPTTTPDATSAALPADGVQSLTVVNIDPSTDPAVTIAVQACAGLCNQKSGGSVFTRMSDSDLQWIEALGLQPYKIIDAGPFLDACMGKFPRCVRYSYDKQQALLPNILTVGAVLEAVPIADEMGIQWGDIVFDATETFSDRNTPYLATQYVYENYVNETTGLAMLNPGYSTSAGTVWDPELIRDRNIAMIDFVFSEKLFVIFLVNGCIRYSEQHDLLNDIVSTNPWPKPIGVYGYANYWLAFGGYLFEAQTLCAESRNMGAIPTTVNNLSFFSTRRAPITTPGEIKQNEPEIVDYDPTQSYVAFIVGDGDNISYMLGKRADWFRQRIKACQAGEDSCPPLTWSISPHLARIAPDVLAWYYKMAHTTGKDYFMLPPSGHLYAYPSDLEETAMQDKFVAATEADARLLGTHSTVHWEFFNKWPYTETEFMPKYAKMDGAIKGLFPVNVPYMFPTGTWEHNQFFKVINGRDGGKTVLFRPREWRGVSDTGGFLNKKFFLSPENMAKELGAYPRGTVTGVYMTSDGGLSLDNALLELVKILPEHVHLVAGDTAVRLALEASKTIEGGDRTLSQP